jgi:N5-(cytidine 5'-diphosphoramidyl)-L-glutamine hydrolase
MRVSNAASYYELRDSIAKDWYSYMNYVLPEANWMLLPNIENDIVHYAKHWNLNGFIFSGGENMGVSPCRDNTELELYNYAKQELIPILGICRGFQAIYSFMGGKIEPQGDNYSKIHRATRHDIIINNTTKSVNSYHNNMAVIQEKPQNINVMATCAADNSLEAFTSDNIVCLLWHPERESEYQEWDAEIIRKLFKYDQ